MAPTPDANPVCFFHSPRSFVFAEENGELKSQITVIRDKSIRLEQVSIVTFGLPGVHTFDVN